MNNQPSSGGVVSGSLTGNQLDSDERERIAGHYVGHWTLADFKRHVPRIIAERDAAEAEVRRLHDENEQLVERALAAIKAIPRRTGSPEWNSGSSVAQAVGFDMGLACAADAVRSALAGLVSRPDEEPRPSVTPQEKPE